MTVEASVFCATKCGKRTSVAIPVSNSLAEVSLVLPWRIVVVETRAWAACSDECAGKLTPELMQKLYEERMANFKIGNAHRFASDDR